MKILFIYESVHHGNTEKLVHEMSGVCGGAALKARDFRESYMDDFDCIGFGSGIYFGRFHKEVEAVLNALPAGEGKAVFLFSTSGRGLQAYNRKPAKMLQSRGYCLCGDFSCKGYDTYGLLKKIGGIAKGHPDENDMEKAREFIVGLAERMCREMKTSETR